MNPFPKYICDQLASRLEERSVVVWYDPPGDFIPFIEALDPKATPGTLSSVEIGGRKASLALFDGSFFSLRAVIEPVVSKDQPEPLLIYIPNVDRDRANSLLMEMEKGGECLDPQTNWSLKRLARTVLREKFTDGDIDQMLTPAKLTYQDVEGFLKQSTGNGKTASMLKIIFESVTDNAIMLALWLADASNDKAIQKKEAVSELYKLISARLGLALDATVSLAEARTKCARYVLANEFRSDLVGEPPSSLGLIPQPSTKDQLNFACRVAETLRDKHAVAYASLADTVEKDLAQVSRVNRKDNVNAAF